MFEYAMQTPNIYINTYLSYNSLKYKSPSPPHTHTQFGGGGERNEQQTYTSLKDENILILHWEICNKL